MGVVRDGVLARISCKQLGQRIHSWRFRWCSRCHFWSPSRHPQDPSSTAFQQLLYFQAPPQHRQIGRPFFSLQRHGHPLASVTFQNALVFQVYAVLSSAFDSNSQSDPPSYRSVALGGVGAGAFQSFQTMLIAGGLAGVASWVFCYPLDVVKSRLQAQAQLQHHFPPPKYNGIIDCLRKSVREEGHHVLWRGLGTTVTRAFVVNGAIFAAYEVAMRCLFNNGRETTEEKEDIQN